MMNTSINDDRSETQDENDLYLVFPLQEEAPPESPRTENEYVDLTEEHDEFGLLPSDLSFNTADERSLINAMPFLLNWTVEEQHQFWLDLVEEHTTTSEFNPIASHMTQILEDALDMTEGASTFNHHDRGVLTTIEPYLSTNMKLEQLTNTCCIPSVDPVTLLGWLGIRHSSSIFDSNWTMVDFEKLISFISNSINQPSHSITDITTLEAFTQEPISSIHPVLLYKLPAFSTPLHLSYFYDYVQTFPYRTAQTPDQLPRNPYTNTPLCMEDIQNLIDRYNQVASVFKLKEVVPEA